MPFSIARPTTYTALTRQTVKQHTVNKVTDKSGSRVPPQSGNIVENNRIQNSEAGKPEGKEPSLPGSFPLLKMQSLAETAVSSMLLTEEESLEEMMDCWHLEENCHTC